MLVLIINHHLLCSMLIFLQKTVHFCTFDAVSEIGSFVMHTTAVNFCLIVFIVLRLTV